MLWLFRQFSYSASEEGEGQNIWGASNHTEFSFYFGQNIGALALLPPLVPSALDLIEWQTEDALFSGAAS